MCPLLQTQREREKEREREREREREDSNSFLEMTRILRVLKSLLTTYKKDITWVAHIVEIMWKEKWAARELGTGELRSLLLQKNIIDIPLLFAAQNIIGSHSS
mgnify:FL=1